MGCFIFAVVSTDMMQTWHNFTICKGACDLNPILNQLASMFGPTGVFIWLPIEFGFLFGLGFFWLYGLRIGVRYFFPSKA